MNERLILVTGGTGYVGSALVPALAEHYRVRTYDSQLFGNAIVGTPNVEAIQGDIRDWEALDQAVKGVTDVIHMAGIVTDELVDINPEKARHINCDALVGLLILCNTHRVGRFILMSSSSVYGNIENATEETVPQPQTEYARQKLAQEELVEANSVLLPSTIIRSATLCGPAPRMRLDTIVNTFCKQAWFDKRITVWGGQQVRTNVHVNDLVEFYLWLLDQTPQDVSGRVFNVTSGNHRAVDLANMVARIHGSARVEVDADKVDHRSYSMLATRARDWGWKPTGSVEQAVRDNFEWFRQGHIVNPNDDLHYNNRRLAPMMRGEA